MIGLWVLVFLGICVGLEGYILEYFVLFCLLIGFMVLLFFVVLIKMCLFDIKDIFVIFFLGFLGFVFYYILLNIGEKIVSVGVVSLFVIIVLIFFVMLFCLFFRGNFGFVKWIGFMISLLGVLLIVFGVGDYIYLMKGILFILLVVFLESIYFVF